MDKSNEEDFTRALNELMAFYEAHAISHEIWWKALESHALERVVAAFEAHITDPENGMYPPKPAHIINQIERLYPKRLPYHKPYVPSDEPPKIAAAVPSLTYLKTTPLYWEKYREGFNKYGLRGLQLACWAREQAGVSPVLVNWFEEHADDPLVKRAHLLAAGLGDDEDKRQHIADLRAMIAGKGISAPLPYDKTRREEAEHEPA